MIKLPGGMFFFIKSSLQICLYWTFYDAYLFLEINKNKKAEYLLTTI